MKLWENRSPENHFSLAALALIEGHQLLISHFGDWPTFEDAEILSMEFARGNHEEVVRTGAWHEWVAPSLTTSFYVFDALYAPDDPRRRPARVVIRFVELLALEMEGFNYQNPVCGLSLEVHHSEALRTQVLSVNWGGTGTPHEVSLQCSKAQVLLVSARGGV